MMENYLGAAASGLGVALYSVLLHGLKRKQAACRSKHGRGLGQQAAYLLGRLGAASGHKAAQKCLRWRRVQKRPRS